MSKGKGRKKKKSPLPKIKDPGHFFNRELSWLEFNSRVLFQAEDQKVPLLERFRFLSIYTSNLDEFVMKRVGGIKRYRESDYTFVSADGLSADIQLEKIRRKILEDNAKLEPLFLELKKELQTKDIWLLDWEQLSETERVYCDQYFLDNYFPILTPLSVDPGKPFPFISNLSYSFGLLLESPVHGENIFSRVKVPSLARNWVELPSSPKGRRFVNGAHIIQNNLSHLYRGMKILDVAPFKVTRNADWDHDDEDAEDLLEAVEESINERRLQEPIRLEVLRSMSKPMLEYLLSELEINEEDIYFYDSVLDFMSMESVANMDVPSLKYPDWRPVTLPWAQRECLYDKIKEKDRLVHHPYESFTNTVEKLVVQSAQDPNVLSIKMTLYRTGDNSPFIKALIDAAENGKQVVCLIELKARFDEKRNIFWARKMEQAGVHVVYGVVGLKTHSKLTLIARQEAQGLVQYAHIATGNYNSKTARLYTDVGLLTVNKKLVYEINEVFNYLTGTSLKVDYKELLVAPINAKSSFIKKINNEAKLAKSGSPAHIIAKMNSLEDIEITNALYKASQAGVKIDLIVRGFCSLRPGVKGLSENISVSSVIGRFLEHSRIFYFSNGQSAHHGPIYIGSADWMHRNMHNRVEVMTPIYSEEIKKQLYDFLYVILNDKGSCWELKPDGSYKLRSENAKSATHHVMMERYLELARSIDI